MAPDDTVANLFLGASRLALGDSAAAVEPLRIAVRNSPSDRNARIMLAEALLRSGRAADALPNFRAVAESLPGNARVLSGLAECYEAVAADNLRTLASEDAASPALAVLEAEALLDDGRASAAFARLRGLPTANDNFAEVHTLLARAYHDTGHPDWAATEKTRAAQAQPLPATALYLSAKQNRALAAETYGRLAALGPSPELHIHRARDLERRGLYPRAVDEWREVLTLDSHAAGAAAGLAWALFRARDYTAALPVIEGLLKQAPSSADWNFLYGAALLNLERPTDAIAYLKKALAAHAGFHPAEAALGQALLATGDPGGAIPLLRAALPFDEDGSTHFQLARACRLAKRRQEAKDAAADYQRFRAQVAARRNAAEAVTAP